MKFKESSLSGPMGVLAFTVLTALLCPWPWVAPVRAEVSECSIPKEIRDTRPDPQGVTTKVQVGLYVIDINAINDVAQTFTADFHLTLKWQDSRLANEAMATLLAGCRMPLDGVWHPMVRVLNQRDLNKHESDFVEIDSDGMITYAQRFYGELSAPFNLTNFPQDDHVLPITLASFAYGPEEVTFVVDTEETGQYSTFSIVGWAIGSETARIGSAFFAPSKQYLSRIDYELQARRYGGFYVWKVIMPLALIVFMSWMVFWIDPALLIPQVSIAATSFLTLIAFQYSVVSVLPRISYLTHMDLFVIGCSILVFLALAEAILSCTVTSKGNQPLGVRIDRWSRVLFPSGFALIVTAAFFL